VTTSRRDFIKTSSASLIGTSVWLQSTALQARTLKLPLALQLYSVRELLPKDYQGTLNDIASLGFTEVESAGYYNHTAAEVKQAIANARLNLVSAHHPLPSLQKELDHILAFSKELGLTYIVCSSPGLKDPSRYKNLKPGDPHPAFTLEDWHWNAEQLNMLGEKVTAAGFKFGYHNHYTEFKATDGVVPYDELMRLTDPAKVTMEMDCGWVVVGGGNPIEYLRKYPTRITMLHVKDFKRKAVSAPADSEPVVAELGLGSIDYRPIFEEAAKAGQLKHIFAEQEAFNVPPKESLKIDADYLRKLGLG
jgi:sugar phosphate isomerase/epimerase